MDSDSIAIFLPEEEGRKRSSCKPGRRFFCILALVAFISLTVLFSIVLGISVTNAKRYESLKDQYDNLRNDNAGKVDYSKSNVKLKTLIDSRINESDYTWKRQINAQIDGVMRIGETQDKIRSRMNDSFKNITYVVNNLILRVDNVILSISRINTTSDRKIENLRNVLTGIKGDLNRTRTALMQINGSVEYDLKKATKSLNVALTDLKKEVRNLTSSTTAKVQELWDHLNATNAEFERALKEIAADNKTIHLTIEDHSKSLYNEVKMVEKKLAKLSNNTIVVTTKDKKDLEKELNNTRRQLKELFGKGISQTRSNFNKKMESFEKQLNSSLANVRTSIGVIKKQTHTNVTNLIDKQKNIKEDLIKTKVNIETIDRRLQFNISALAVKIQNITNSYVQLKDNFRDEKSKRIKLENELQDMRSIIEKLQNKANGILEKSSTLVVILVSFVFLHI